MPDKPDIPETRPESGERPSFTPPAPDPVKIAEDALAIAQTTQRSLQGIAGVANIESLLETTERLERRLRNTAAEFNSMQSQLNVLEGRRQDEEVPLLDPQTMHWEDDGYGNQPSSQESKAVAKMKWEGTEEMAQTIPFNVITRESDPTILDANEDQNGIVIKQAGDYLIGGEVHISSGFGSEGFAGWAATVSGSVGVSDDIDNWYSQGGTLGLDIEFDTPEYVYVDQSDSEWTFVISPTGLIHIADPPALVIMHVTTDTFTPIHYGATAKLWAIQI